jgi:hypothetical protein
MKSPTHASLSPLVEAVYSLGYGVNRFSANTELQGQVVLAKDSIKPKPPKPDAEHNTFYTFVIDQHDKRKVLKLDAGADAKGYGVVAKARYKLQDILEISNTSFHLVVGLEQTTKILSFVDNEQQFGGLILGKDADDNKENPEEFLRVCGDSFVGNVTLGRYIYIVISITLDEKTRSRMERFSSKASYKGDIKADGKIDMTKLYNESWGKFTTKATIVFDGVPSNAIPKGLTQYVYKINSGGGKVTKKAYGLVKQILQYAKKFYKTKIGSEIVLEKKYFSSLSLPGLRMASRLTSIVETSEEYIRSSNEYLDKASIELAIWKERKNFPDLFKEGKQPLETGDISTAISGLSGYVSKLNEFIGNVRRSPWKPREGDMPNPPQNIRETPTRIGRNEEVIVAYAHKGESGRRRYGKRVSYILYDQNRFWHAHAITNKKGTRKIAFWSDKSAKKKFVSVPAKAQVYYGKSIALEVGVDGDLREKDLKAVMGVVVGIQR